MATQKINCSKINMKQAFVFLFIYFYCMCEVWEWRNPAIYVQNSVWGCS